MDQSGGNQEFEYRPQVSAAAALPQQQAQIEAQISPEAESQVMQWNASEFIDHQKSAGWFIPLVALVIVLAVVAYLLSRDILVTVVIVMAGAAFGTFAKQKPRTLTYSLLPTTIKVGDKSYSYDDFRSFSIVTEGALYSVFLEPVKRFMPPLSIYFAKEDGEKIFDTLAMHIPHQERRPDTIDQFMRKIRF